MALYVTEKNYIARSLGEKKLLHKPNRPYVPTGLKSQMAGP